MPILRVDKTLIYFAHVPKCGGSSVELYLEARFGDVAFADRHFLKQPAEGRWSKTSPQHITLDIRDRLFPAGFFDHCFSIVRHPVGRVVSAYHFQRDMEGSIAESVTFSDWLEDIPERLAAEPFAFDNHIRPMADFVPEDADLFYLEHGIDALIMWFDEVTGVQAEPRALPWHNAQADRKTERVTPSEYDLKRIAEIYAADFERFPYALDDPKPQVAAPVLTAEVVAARDAERAKANGLKPRLREMARKILKPGA